MCSEHCLPYNQVLCDVLMHFTISRCISGFLAQYMGVLLCNVRGMVLWNVQGHEWSRLIPIDPYEINIYSIAQCLVVLRNVCIMCIVQCPRSRSTTVKSTPIQPSGSEQCGLNNMYWTIFSLYWRWRWRWRWRTYTKHKRPPSGRGLIRVWYAIYHTAGTVLLYCSV